MKSALYLLPALAALLLCSCAPLPIGYGVSGTAITPYGDVTYTAPRALPVGYAKGGK